MEIKNCLLIYGGLINENGPLAFLKKLPFVECILCSTVDKALGHIYSKNGVDLVIIKTSPEDNLLNDFFDNIVQSPPVIVISESDKHAIQAFDLDSVVDIILQPFDKNRLLRALSKAWGIRHTENSISGATSVFLKCGRAMKRFFYDRIEYIEAYGIYSKVYYEGTKVVVNENISNLEHLLDKRKFRRVHKSYMVNLNNVQEIDAKGLQLESRNEKIPFGAKYKPLVASLFNLHCSDTF